MKEKNLKIILGRHNLDAAVFFQDSYIPYFSGVSLSDREWRENAVLVIGKTAVLYVRRLEVERVKTASKVDVMPLEELNIPNSIGVNGRAFTISHMNSMKEKKVVDISHELEQLRMVKEEAEIKLIREACRIGDSVFSEVVKNWKFMTEGEVRQFIVKEIENRRASPSFNPIVASGKNAAFPHYQGNDKLSEGFCVIDFGVCWKGYCSDMTRTVYLGNPSEEEKELYSKVLESQKAGITAVKPGTSAEDVDFSARNKLGKLQNLFIHSLGHQLGIDVHDAGFRIGPEVKSKLAKNMVITIEPGIYMHGKYGIRIEDDIVVGRQVLTESKKSLIIIPYS